MLAFMVLASSAGFVLAVIVTDLKVVGGSLNFAGDRTRPILRELVSGVPASMKRGGAGRCEQGVAVETDVDLGDTD